MNTENGLKSKIISFLNGVKRAAELKLKACRGDMCCYNLTQAGTNNVSDVAKKIVMGF